MKALRLKEFRETKNLSQRELAQRLGITQAYYWKWEIGKSFPNAKQILKLCDTLECSPNDLFGFKGVHAVVIERLEHD
ncbi:helix-turn-helix domain-containing protein [Mariniplasma anaerobium]|uniref:Uncharacterized protein n=1 Tax=Mariniplasma anaerobium TaxID=2735436 RepID=A0A7U9XWM6_9MOLU|nr:helix-turn-helix transcriptional regulator [Mariniplasma anaerobium]BCR36594.1 hypothetical protein MPAN_014870 [Mariniplasma anaerobium]